MVINLAYFLFLIYLYTHFGTGSHYVAMALLKVTRPAGTHIFILYSRKLSFPCSAMFAEPWV